MAYTFPAHRRGVDGRYGPTKNRRFYKPVGYHQPTARPNPNKTRWRIPESNQYEVFRLADESGWENALDNHKYSVIDRGDFVLGATGERIAKFPSSATNDWHGYPVSGPRLTPELLDQWHSGGIVSDRIRRKLHKGEL